jgi:hypothetical protein
MGKDLFVLLLAECKTFCNKLKMHDAVHPPKRERLPKPPSLSSNPVKISWLLATVVTSIQRTGFSFVDQR